MRCAQRRHRHRRRHVSSIAASGSTPGLGPPPAGDRHPRRVGRWPQPSASTAATAGRRPASSSSRWVTPPPMRRVTAVRASRPARRGARSIRRRRDGRPGGSQVRAARQRELADAGLALDTDPRRRWHAPRRPRRPPAATARCRRPGRAADRAGAGVGRPRSLPDPHVHHAAGRVPPAATCRQCRRTGSRSAVVRRAPPGAGAQLVACAGRAGQQRLTGRRAPGRAGVVVEQHAVVGERQHDARGARGTPAGRPAAPRPRGGRRRRAAPAGSARPWSSPARSAAASASLRQQVRLIAPTHPAGDRVVDRHGGAGQRLEVLGVVLVAEDLRRPRRPPARYRCRWCRRTARRS